VDKVEELTEVMQMPQRVMIMGMKMEGRNLFNKTFVRGSRSE
jgi:DNA-binding transcriptional regulator GbsR (MarR family)